MAPTDHSAGTTQNGRTARRACRLTQLRPAWSPEGAAGTGVGRLCGVLTDPSYRARRPPLG